MSIVEIENKRFYLFKVIMTHLMKTSIYDNDEYVKYWKSQFFQYFYFFFYYLIFKIYK